MTTRFTKMHGLGNDFVVIDATEQAIELNRQQLRAIADRRFGIGCDQILVLRAGDRDEYPVRYEIWNADGSPAAQCGNGARCVALYLERIGAGLQQPLQVGHAPADRRVEDGRLEHRQHRVHRLGTHHVVERRHRPARPDDRPPPRSFPGAAACRLRDRHWRRITRRRFPLSPCGQRKRPTDGVTLVAPAGGHTDKAPAPDGTARQYELT